jgi:ABC-type transport system involved in Fe-S cluster assembly fused permease/ATPase subunit
VERRDPRRREEVLAWSADAHAIRIVRIVPMGYQRDVPVAGLRLLHLDDQRLAQSSLLSTEPSVERVP